MPVHNLDIEAIFESFKNQRILVVGDLMLDTYLTGKVNRISPEAPVPVLDYLEEENRLGGAANVALNLACLGAKPLLCGFLGQDDAGKAFSRILIDEFLDTDGILVSHERRTTVKTRFMAGTQQILRLDKESRHSLSAAETERLLLTAVRLMDQFEVTGLIFQDYNKGVLTAEVIRALLEEAKKRNLVVSVDPKLDNFWNYKGVTLFKPNLKEVGEALQSKVAANIDSLDEAASKIFQRIYPKFALISLSENGLFLGDQHFAKVYATKERTVADVCGAGDTVIAIAALAVGAGLPPEEIAMLANMAGGQVVEKKGVEPVNLIQLKAELRLHLLEANA
jgi:rfaE bifunctional protein kinase chain/domain